MKKWFSINLAYNEYLPQIVNEVYIPKRAEFLSRNISFKLVLFPPDFNGNCSMQSKNIKGKEYKEIQEIQKKIQQITFNLQKPQRP